MSANPETLGGTRVRATAIIDATAQRPEMMARSSTCT